MNVVLKPQDVLILLKLATRRSRDLSFGQLAQSLGMSPSEVHAGVQRAQQARLYSEATKEPVWRNLLEFALHGVKYAFPAELGGRTRGVPTAHAAPPLHELLASEDPTPPVWPAEFGTVSGLAFSPLYRSAPVAASQDQRLYELLCLVDALRSGRAREQQLAARLLAERLTPQPVAQ